ncbi:MAG: L,D-transpeptidase [Sporolactobacillus sp.]|jgi:lipoprotein-anchoring transpeptidase ErfK/SrfK|nr:L,D-transpeptidase [Sporolactobacillus sp.]
MDVLKKLIVIITAMLAVGLSACTLEGAPSGTTDAHDSRAQKTTDSAKSKTETPAKINSKQTIDWNKPSGGAYPALKQGENVWVDVSIGKQRAYLKEGTRTLYKMIISTGQDNGPDTTTPRGTFYIQAERGKWFFSSKYQEGAKYWISWKNHGEFLFHSVPMDKNGHVLKKDAAKLGEKDSHGCIHLTIADAKWLYEHLPYGTKVVIH